MAEAKLDFTADTSSAQKAIDQLTKSLSQTREEVRKLKTQSREHTDEAISGQMQLASAIAAGAARITSLGALVRTVYSEWQNRAEKLLALHERIIPQLTKGLAESGRLDQAPEMQKFLAEQQKKGISREHQLQAFGGVAKEGHLSAKQQRDLAGEVGKFGKTGVDLDALGGLAAGIQRAAPEMTAGDVLDTAMQLKRNLGDKAGELTGHPWQKGIERLKEQGMSGPDALAMAASALRRDEKGKSLALLEQHLEHPGRMSREERENYKKIFDPTAVGEMAGQLEQARVGDFGAQQLAATPPEAEAANIIAVKQDEASARTGPGASARKNIQDARREGLEGKPGISAGIQRNFDSLFRQIDKLSRFVGLETNESQAKSMADAAVKAGTMTEGESGAILAELRKQTRQMQIDSILEKHKKNVDAHTE